MQSEAEIRHVADEWVRNFQPTVAPRLILTDAAGQKNFEKLGQRCFDKGHVSISYLTESYNELAAAGQLELTPEPRAKTQEELAAEFQAKELIRIQKEKLENAVPFHDKVTAFEKAKKDAEKEKARQVAALAERDRLIDNYSINLGPGRIDHARSQNLREQLRKINVTKNGKTDWVGVLALVQEALSKMP
jgi:hypothetical protein